MTCYNYKNHFLQKNNLKSKKFNYIILYIGQTVLNTEKKTALIIGIGYLGLKLAKELLKLNYKVIGTTRNSEKKNLIIENGFNPLIWEKNILNKIIKINPNLIISTVAPTQFGDDIINLINEYLKSYNGWLGYISATSVYGGNKKIPFSIDDRVEKPLSLYAASKRSNELIAYSYSYLYGLHTTGLRFFTVYGPWGRPDMAMFIFTQKILANETIPIYNFGRMNRRIPALLI